LGESQCLEHPVLVRVEVHEKRTEERVHCEWTHIQQRVLQTGADVGTQSLSRRKQEPWQAKVSAREKEAGSRMGLVLA
jgi:hypothetical protein